MLALTTLGMAAVMQIASNGLALGQPTTYQMNVIQTRDATCNISMYTADYFSGVAIQKSLSECLFWSGGISDVAAKYSLAVGTKVKTMWDNFPCDLYDPNGAAPDSVVACITNNTVSRQTYFQNMMMAMSKICTDTATLMAIDPTNIKTDGTIWGAVQDTVKGQSKNFKIIDPRGSSAPAQKRDAHLSFGERFVTRDAATAAPAACAVNEIVSAATAWDSTFPVNW